MECGWRVCDWVSTCSSDSWEMWLTAAYDSILGLKWLMMALRGNKGVIKVL